MRRRSSRAPRKMEVQAVAFAVFVREGEVEKAWEALKVMTEIDAQDARVHEAVVRLRKTGRFSCFWRG